MYYRLYSLGAYDSNTVAKQLIIKSPQQEDTIPSNSSSGTSINKLQHTPSQEDIENTYRDGFLCNDISELFGLFDSNLNTLSSNHTITTESATSLGKQLNIKHNDTVNENKNNKQYKSLAGNNLATCSTNGQQIMMNSSETFPLSNTLKDIILDLDIGKTVRIAPAV